MALGVAGGAENYCRIICGRMRCTATSVVENGQLGHGAAGTLGNTTRLYAKLNFSWETDLTTASSVPATS